MNLLQRVFSAIRLGVYCAFFVGTLAVPIEAQVILPKPEPRFTGKLNRDERKSVPVWPAELTPPKGAPNVVLILIDDVGFSTTSTFGGPVNTPNFTRLAASGLRYNEFHVNAICAPSRAALLSGRNNHEIGFWHYHRARAGLPRLQHCLAEECCIDRKGARRKWL